MMRNVTWLASAAALGIVGAVGGMLASGLASAQDRPESLLPPGFDDPTPTPSPAPTAGPRTAPPGAPAITPGTGTPVVQPIPGDLPAVPSISSEELSRLPTLEELESMTPDELDDLLGLKPKFDIPPGARRSMERVGVLARDEGGLPSASLARQPAGLIRAVLAGTKRPMVSRWGHILMRRALASRLAAPQGMNPAEFVALRAAVLNRMGEFAIARALVQDVDTGNWSTPLTNEALKAYVATNDLTGACPVVRLQGSSRDDPQWVLMQGICNAYAGEGALAGAQLDRALGQEIAPPIDVLLAQRFAGAAGRGRRAVEIEWEEVEEINPWRFALANALGEPIPENLLADALGGAERNYYAIAGATSAMLPLPMREQMAQTAARRGVLSSKAMVNLYSLIYADDTIEGDATSRAALLREAYVAEDADARIMAMRQLWGDDADYAARVTTAFAAARVPPSEDHAAYAGGLIASMLSAGLDRDAAAWRGTMADGSLGWALIAVGVPGLGAADAGALDSFVDNDDSPESRASAFLVAGLAGLDRLSAADRDAFAERLEFDLARQTRWTRTIDRAAEVNNAGLVSLLVGLGMQGEDWSQMTPLHLYHIVSALRRVGLEAEARMIAAEAVARA